MLCGICGRDGARLRRTTRVYGKGKGLLAIEAIPLVKCGQCHESYYTAEALHEVQRTEKQAGLLAAERAVRVARFAATPTGQAISSRMSRSVRPAPRRGPLSPRAVSSSAAAAAG